MSNRTLRLKTALQDLDIPIIAATIALLVIGVLSIYSSGVTAEGLLVSNDYIKQIIWGATGVFLMILFSAIDYQRLKDYSFIVYIAFIILLIGVKLFGKVINGSRSWIGVGDVGGQPSEFSKLAVILFLAQYLENSEHDNGLRRLLISFAIILLPVGLILLQPDFGTALVFFPILIAMIIVAGLDWRYIIFIVAIALGAFTMTVLPLWEKDILKQPTSFLFVFYQAPYVFYLLGGCGVIFILAAWGWLSYKKPYYFWIAYVSLIVLGSVAAGVAAHKMLKDYQMMRLMVFMDPSIDPRGSGWNIIQSITAIGSGGFTGKGFLQGTQSHYRYLPEQSTDFIFSIIGEETGFLGGLFVFALFFVLLSRCVSIMRTVRDHYALYVIAGITGMIFFHFIVNVGMVMGIMPITGIPLFFLSYGGSSLWVILISMGIVLGISSRRYRM